MTTEETARYAIKLADQGNEIWARFIADAAAKAPKKRTALEKAVIKIMLKHARD